jgi:hypothetical protein
MQHFIEGYLDKLKSSRTLISSNWNKRCGACDRFDRVRCVAKQPCVVAAGRCGRSACRWFSIESRITSLGEELLLAYYTTQ